MPIADFVHEMMATDLMSSLPDRNLTKVDRATMAVGSIGVRRFCPRALSSLRGAFRSIEGFPHQGKLICAASSPTPPTRTLQSWEMGFSAPLDSWLAATSSMG